LATVLLATARPIDKLSPTPPVSGGEGHADRLRPASVANLRVISGGEVRAHLTALAARPSELTPIWAAASSLGFARRAGVALGVLDRRGGVIRLGPRAEQWSNLAPDDQTRALARVWLVNDGLSGGVPAPVRTALARLLKASEPGAWYQVGSVARFVA